jgi:hypothetical protein
LRKGLAKECVYVAGHGPDAVRQQGAAMAQNTAPTHEKQATAQLNMQQRIAQLEGMVISLMEKQSRTDESSNGDGDGDGGATDSSIPPLKPFLHDDDPTKEAGLEDAPEKVGGSPLVESFGQISLKHSETSYVESGHWSALLDKVSMSQHGSTLSGLFSGEGAIRQSMLTM